MVEILGYGIYIPYYRIMLSEIRKAWNLSTRINGQKSVPGRDENVLSMAHTATQVALKNIKPEEIEMLVFITTTSPYSDSSLASQLAVSLFEDKKDYSNIDALDIQASTRSTTMGLKVVYDAINSGRIQKALLIGADVLVAAPGQDLELTSAAGAAALILGKDNGLAKIEDFFGYVTGFTDIWTLKGDYPRQSLPRFVRNHGYVDHCVASMKGLLKKRNETIENYNQVIIQPSNARYFTTVGKKMRIPKEKLEHASKPFMAFGNTGCASILIGLVSSLEHSAVNDKILLTSYGSGMSDSVSLTVKKQVSENNTLENYMNEKKYLNYFSYLRYNNIVKPFIQ